MTVFGSACATWVARRCAGGVVLASIVIGLMLGGQGAWVLLREGALGQASGPGVVATRQDLCGRGVPADSAQACRAAESARAATQVRRGGLLLAFGLACGLLIPVAWLRVRAARRNARSSGQAARLRASKEARP